MKKVFRSAVSVILSLLIVFSAAVSAFATNSESNELAEIVAEAKKYYPEAEATEETTYSNQFTTQSIVAKSFNVYDYLVDFLVEEGDYDSGLYYIGGATTTPGVSMEFLIFYKESTGTVAFYSDILNGNIYIYMLINPDSVDSYEIQGYDPYLSYRGYGTIYPQSYPHVISIEGDPNSPYYDYYSNLQFQDLVNQCLQMSIPYWNTVLANNTDLNMGNLGFTKIYSPNPTPAKKTYTINFDSNGGTSSVSSQTKEKKTDLILTKSVPQRYGYKFLGWSTNKNATKPEYYPGGLFTIDSNTTLYAVWEKDYSVKIYDSSVKIVNNPGTVTVRYKTMVYLTVETIDMPEGAYIKWYVNEQDTGITDNQFSFEGTGTVTVSVKAFDKDGEIMRNVDGNEIADSEKIIVNNSFFHRLIQAIRRLFFGVSIYQQ